MGSIDGAPTKDSLHDDSMALRHTVGRRLRELREARGMSQREVAAAVGKSPSTWSSTEAGDSSPPIDVLERAAEVLGVSMAEVFGYAPGSLHMGSVGARGRVELLGIQMSSVEEIVAGFDDLPGQFALVADEPAGACDEGDILHLRTVGTFECDDFVLMATARPVALFIVMLVAVAEATTGEVQTTGHFSMDQLHYGIGQDLDARPSMAFTEKIPHAGFILAVCDSHQVAYKNLDLRAL